MKKINPKLNELVSILSDGEMHDGDALGEQLGITRAAIWKMIEKLKEYDISIISTKGKGYQLITPFSLLDVERITQAFAGSAVDVVCFDSIASTNDYFKLQNSPNLNALAVCVAECQTQGRGRLGRAWFSPYGQNIYLSCRYFLEKDMSELGGLSLVAGLSIVEILKKLGVDSNIAVKWPNDVMWQGRKLAGVLVEVRAEAHGLSEVIIGIGMNVNCLPESTKKITQPVASLSEIQGAICDRTQLVIQLIKQIVVDLMLFKRAGWSAFAVRWQQVDYLNSKLITLLLGEKNVVGVAKGVNDQGYLLLQKQEDGRVMSFSSGEASIKKEV